jgi:hypothetical protein
MPFLLDIFVSKMQDFDIPNPTKQLDDGDVKNGEAKLLTLSKVVSCVVGQLLLEAVSIIVPTRDLKRKKSQVRQMTGVIG